ncbi:MAG: VWA domain-containing protein [Deltaproteobacteria bacterium]|nr:VWA domain-containing protein [Deltaproteobacteria bacterium]
MSDKNTPPRVRKLALLAALVGLTGLAGAAQQRANTPSVPMARAQAPAIDAVFVLDTTGSMGGLIDGAKQKIWSIANQMASGQPSPRIRLGLVAYRDRGDAYVTQRFDLTDDLDAIYGHLLQLQAGGGGDTPESVNQALGEAVSQMSWTEGPGVYRAVFLVGDAPPHMDYADDVPYTETIAIARQRGIVVNTVQCGGLDATRPVWQAIASLGAGHYAAVPQNGGMVAVHTPMDDELGVLNQALADTAMAWGTVERRNEFEDKVARARSAPASVASARLAYMAKSPERGVASGRRDLIGALDAGEVDLDSLPEVELPAELRSLEPEEQRALIAGKKDERERIQKKVAQLVAERDAWIADERERSGGGKADAFDLKVLDMLREQAADAGLDFSSTSD